MRSETCSEVTDNSVWGKNPYAAIVDEIDENSDVLFEIGEVITLKGGRFKIHNIGKKFIVL